MRLDRDARPGPTGVGRLFIALSLTLCGAGCAPDVQKAGAADAGTDADADVIAVVNGEPLHQAELQLALGALLARTPPVSREDVERARRQARDELIDDLLQAQLAVERGLDTDPAVRGRLAYYRIKVLADASRQAFVRTHPVSEQALREEYGEPAQEYHLQHILLGRPRDAADLLTRLAQGQDFGELAKLYSVDGSSADRQGDLGWLRLDQLPDYRMADAVRGLAAGAYTTEAVQGPNGWHVLRLMESPRPAAGAPAFAQLPAESRRHLSERVRQRELDRAMQRARSDARIEFTADTDAVGGTPVVADDRVQG